MSWEPSASLKTLRARARILAQLRAFFAARDVLEVETPALSRAGATDPALTHVSARVRVLGEAPLYLQTSPEFAMKRLLAAGSGDIFQISRVYRDAELGRWHQPEFTLLEWYRVGWSEFDLMDEVNELLARVLGDRQHSHLSYRDAFTRHLGVDPHAGTDTLTASLEARGVTVPVTLDERGVLDLALSAAIVPQLPRDALTFIYDFPADQAALARIKPQTPPVAARFEVFFAGLELGNGFAELTDPAEQRARFEAERALRLRAGHRAPPIDEALLAALEHGLPECAGVAIGVDRLVAAAAGLGRIDAAVSFAHRRS